MTICIICKEADAVSSRRCQACKDAINLGGKMMGENHKWRVAIQVCDSGHRYVPVKGRCLQCDKERNYENKMLDLRDIVR